MIQKLQPTVVRFGVFELDLQTSELRRNGRTIPLQGQPVKLLILLATHPGELVTRKDIESALWPDRIVEFEHLINDAVRRIRKALADDPDNPKYVQTLHGRGYRFIAPVPEVRPDDPAPAIDVPLHPSDRQVVFDVPPVVVPPEPAPPHEFVVPIPRWLARGLFLLIQSCYLALHTAVLLYNDALARGLIALGITPIQVTLPAAIALAMCSIALRIYLLSAIGWGHPAAGEKFRQLFPVVLVVDALWAASPLLLEGVDIGIVLIGIAGLAYVPFAERTLVRSLYPALKTST